MGTSKVEELAAELIRRNWTVAVAESVTGGRIQALLTSLSGASRYFVGGLTAYSIDQKVRLLGINAAHAAEVNCVSERVAAEMAQGVADLFRASVALAITGYAEADETWHILEPMGIMSVWCREPSAMPGTSSRPRTVNAKGNRGAAQAALAECAIDYLLEVVRIL